MVRVFSSLTGAHILGQAKGRWFRMWVFLLLPDKFHYIPHIPLHNSTYEKTEASSICHAYLICEPIFTSTYCI